MGNHYPRTTSSWSCRKTKPSSRHDHWTLSQVLKYAQTGDLLLQRKIMYNAQMNIYLHASLFRSLAAAQTNQQFLIERSTLPSWTNVGMLVWDEPHERLYVLEGTMGGLVLTPFVQVMEDSKAHAQNRFALRPYHHHHHHPSSSSSSSSSCPTFGLPENDTPHQSLSHILVFLQQLSPRERSWPQVLQLIQTKTKHHSFHHPDQERLLSRLTQSILSCVRSGLMNLPLEQRLELQHAFCTLDENQDGHLDRGEIERVVQFLALSKAIEQVGKHEVDEEGGSSSLQSKSDLESVMNALDRDHDGEISLLEFIQTMSTLPRQSVSLEYDLPGLFSSATICSLYDVVFHEELFQDVGHEQERVHHSRERILPEDFASSSTVEWKKAFWGAECWLTR